MFSIRSLGSCALVAQLAVVAIFPASKPLSSQVRAPWDGGRTRSLGQPRPWKPHAGMGSGWRFQQGSGQLLTEGRIGVYRDLLNPVTGLLGIDLEGYLGARNDQLEHGARIQVVSPYLRLGIGADYSGLDDDLNFLVSFRHPVRRGGIVGFGSLLRVDYLPGRNHSFSLGLEIPFRRGIPMGRTRPTSDHVSLDARPPRPLTIKTTDQGLTDALSNVGEAAHWIHRYTIPFVDHDALDREHATEAFREELLELKEHRAERTPLHPDGRTPAAEVEAYHTELLRAFCVAAGSAGAEWGCESPDGRRAYDEARRVLLDEVLLPYNRLLGQIKKDDTILQFGSRARGIFVRWLHTESGLSGDRADAVLWVFNELVSIIDSNRGFAHEQWEDSRFVWLPLQYALLPHEHDSQAELDELVERAVEERFTEGNLVWYLLNEQFQCHLSRMIHDTEDYHVLWIHDFRGYDSYGNPDEVAFRQVVHSYLESMTRRARQYDETGRFPTYMIFLDQWFYERNQGRLWMSLLEDPLHHRLKLPAEFRAWEDSVAAMQERLRVAVESSHLLRDQAYQYGESWLRSLVKVHVGITNPADPTFWSGQVVPVLGLPDNLMRDHRKIAFRDITEEDPYRGEAMYTGAGVGEHYTNLSWEDRSLIMRGPAALAVKAAARALLLNQGMPSDQIPYHLQARARGVDYDERVAAVVDRVPTARALELHNETGYAPKPINVMKALLYTLMPPGSVIKAPDSLWNSAFWGSLLLGFSLRGGRALVIAPADENAPSSGFAQLARAEELMSRLVIAQDLLQEEIAASGGLLKVGIYAPGFTVTDISRKVEAVRTSVVRYPWLRDFYGWHPSVYDALDRAQVELSELDLDPPPNGDFEHARTPKLHLKANFFASSEAWSGLMSRPEWVQVLHDFLGARVEQIHDRVSAVAVPGTRSISLIDVGQPMVKQWLSELSAEEREDMVFYLAIGSHNQNYRSMVMDGEVSVVLSNWAMIGGFIDMVSIVGQCQWVEDLDELDRLLPEHSEWQRRFGRWMKLAL